MGEARSYPTLWAVNLKKNIFYELPHHRPSTTPRRSGHASSAPSSSSSTPSARMQNDEQQHQHKQNDHEESSRYLYEQDITTYNDSPAPASPQPSSLTREREPDNERGRGNAIDYDQPDDALHNAPESERRCAGLRRSIVCRRNTKKHQITCEY